MATDRAEGEARAKRPRGVKRKPPPKPGEPPPASIVLRHPKSGEGRRIKLGFAWDLFLFAGLFGVPLFLRGLHAWGAAFLALWLLDLVAGWATDGTVAAALQAALFGAFLVLQLWLGAKGNGITARALLERGWTLDQPENAVAKRALARWGAEV